MKHAQGYTLRFLAVLVLAMLVAAVPGRLGRDFALDADLDFWNQAGAVASESRAEASEESAQGGAAGGQTPSPPEPDAVPQAKECHAAILIYHHISPHSPGEGADVRAMTVSPSALDKQLRYLREHDYTVVPYGSLVDCVVNRVPLPDKAVVITFDDGWSSQYVNALPVLEKYGMTATFFVVTDYVDKGSAILTWKQIGTLAEKGMTIASHSRTHPFLTRTWDPGRLRYEVAGSKKVLEEHLGKPVEFFAYPFGSVDQRVVTAVRAAGYVGARGTYEGTRHLPADLFVMKGVYVTDSLDRFAAEIAK